MDVKLQPLLLALLVTAFVTVVPRAQPADPTVAFTNVTVIPLDRDRALADHTVVVRGDRIVAMTPSAAAKIPPGAMRVDGRGKFLMPGMAEMHAHIPGGPSATDADMQRTLLLFAANGITTIRGMLGEPRHLPLRDAVARGSLIGPTIFTSGVSFNANTAKSADVAVTMVRDQKAAGYDLLKIHPGVPRDVFDAVAAEANKVGISFSGHVPADVGLERALSAKFHSIDHIDGFFEYAVRPDAPVDRGNPGFFGVNFAAHLDPARLAKAIDETKRAGVWIVPTQGLLEIFMSMATPAQLAKSPGVEYMPPPQVVAWTKQRQTFMAQPGFSKENNARFLEERRKLLKALHDAGVDIALGSDAVQTFSVPGFSIFNEMNAMARSGMTPYAIYVTGGPNVARFFNRDKDVGTVTVGKIADLVLVDANPLASVANFEKQSGTMLRGRWHPRADLLGKAKSLQ
ncbi:MAG TPA: amidohydrolase family protein [Vicinamibacterales bacterium]|nr:amidohydrolase family protein [Vicinamibacterales bacterium]